MALRFADHELAALSELRWHPEAKRIRGYSRGQQLVDTTRARIVWEPRRVVPSFAVPVADLHASLTANRPQSAEQPPGSDVDDTQLLDPRVGFSVHSTAGTSFDITTTDTTLREAAFGPADDDFDGYVILDFDAFDEWREEDEVLVGHARDPFKTVDTRRSSRHVVVQIGGVPIADSTRSIMLFETYLPTRYYLPRADVRMELLEASPSTSVCAYKGRARYWSARVGDTHVPDVAWSYEDPDNYATSVKGLICFYNERVDIIVDGELLERPRSPWSSDET